MMAKFNFLASSTARAKADAELRRQFPNHSTYRRNAAVEHIAPSSDVSEELQAPGQFQATRRAAHGTK
jgi:hypothetical protein